MLRVVLNTISPLIFPAKEEAVYRYVITLWSLLVFSMYLTGGVKAQMSINPLNLDGDFTLDFGATVHQSSDGQYWLGTQKGFFRSNGKRVWQYRINDPLSEVIHTQNVQSPILSDDAEKLWFSTYAAIHRFDPITESFITRQIEDDGKPVDEKYRLIYYSRGLNQLWLKAQNRLWSFSIDEDIFRPISLKSNAANYAIYEDDEEGIIYIVGARWMYKGLEITKVDKNGELISYQEIPVDNMVTNALPVSKDSIYCGTADGLSLLVLNGEDFSHTLLPFVNTGGGIFHVTQKNDRHLLVSDYANGVFEVDLSSKETNPVFVNQHNFQDITAVNGGDWAVTQPNHGISILSDTPPLVKWSYPLPEENKVICFRKDVSDVPYLLTENGQIMVKGSAGWKKLIAGSGDGSGIGAPVSFSIDEQSLSVLHTRGIATYRNNGTPLGRHTTRTVLLEGLTGGPESKRFILTENGMERYEFQADTLRIIPIPALSFPGAGYDLSNYSILEDGSVIMAYKGQNIFIVDCSSAKGYYVKRRLKIPGYPISAVSGRSNKIYVATNNGIYVVTGDVVTTLLPDDDRLEGISCNSLILDKQYNLWLGTTKGLYAVNLETDRLVYFSESDGLPTSYFEPVSPIMKEDGIISMATKKGVITFDPRELLRQEQEVIPYIENIWVNDVLQQQDTATAYLKQLTLPWNKNTLFIKADHLIGNDSPLSGTRCQLMGYDEYTSEVSVPHTIRYPNLPPGNYTLQLTAINQNGLLSGQKLLKIIINPPWWKSAWFRAAALLALALIAAAIYIAGLRGERLKQQRLSEQQASLAAERDRIAGEVHDDLGGQISSILYLSEEMLLTGMAPANEYELHRIHELSRTSLQNVRDIIFALDNRRATLAALGEQLRGAGTEFFADRKIAFTCTDTFTRPDFSLTSRQKRNLTLIIKEAWHNTAKHAAATAVSLDIIQSNGTLHLTATDNGKGFTSTKSTKATGGYGLNNMTDKATAIGATATLTSTPGEGTTLRISWPLPHQEHRNAIRP